MFYLFPGGSMLGITVQALEQSSACRGASVVSSSVIHKVPMTRESFSTYFTMGKTEMLMYTVYV